MTRPVILDLYCGAAGTGNVGVHAGPLCMGIDWMTGDELSQAIPPAYTRFIGEQMLAHLALGMAA